MFNLAKLWAKPFYNSAKWKKCRESYIKNIDGLCQTCLEKGEITAGYILHHIAPLTEENINDADITLVYDNLKLPH